MISARTFIIDAEGNETEVHRDLAKEAAEAQAEINALAARVAADPGLPMRAVLHIIGMINEARARLYP